MEIDLIVEKCPDGYVTYPHGLKDVVYGKGSTPNEALKNAELAIQFRLAFFGNNFHEEQPHHTEKVIFVHIPKIAGNSIRSNLKKNFEDSLFLAKQPMLHPHSSMLEIKNELRKYNISCDNTFRFAFVRNPWDWLLSLYFYHIKHPEMKYNGKSVESYGCFENFCEKVDFQTNPCNRKPEVERSTQTSYLIDEDGNLLVDFVGRYENLNEDYNVCIKMINSFLNLTESQIAYQNTILSWENKSPSYSQGKNCRKYYNKKTWELVRDKFKCDVDRFYPNIQY